MQLWASGEMFLFLQCSNLLERIKMICPALVVYACNSSTWNAEAGGLRILGQPGLQSKILSQNK
jgi:hypothetical protein